MHMLRLMQRWPTDGVPRMLSYSTCTWTFARTDVNPVMLNTVLHGLAASSQWTQVVVAV